MADSRGIVELISKKSSSSHSLSVNPLHEKLLKKESKEELSHEEDLQEAIEKLHTDDYDIYAHKKRSKQIREGCVRCCGQCTTCLKVVGKWAEKGFYQSKDFIASVFILPALRGGTHVIKRSLDGAIGVPLFATALSAEVLPIGTEGGWDIPLLGPLARLDRFRMLLKDAFNPEISTSERVQNPLAAITGLFTGIYAAIQFMSIVHNAYLGHFMENLDWDPIHLVENIVEGNHDKLEIFLLTLSAYVGLTKGSIAGENLVLQDFSEWLKKIQTNITKDGTKRQIALLNNMNQHVADEAQKTLMSLNTCARYNWKDVLGRSFEGGLHIVGGIVGTFYDSAHRVTVPKGWLKNNGAIKKGRVRIQGCFSRMQKWCCPKSQDAKPVSNYYPEYGTLLDAKEKEFKTVLLYRGLWKNDGQTPYQRKLTHLLHERLVENMARAKTKMPFLPPVLPSKGIPPIIANWEKAAAKNEFILTLLNKTACEEGINVNVVALTVNTALYYCMTGQKSKLSAMTLPTAQPAASAPPELPKEGAPTLKS